MNWKLNGRLGLAVACLLTACASRKPVPLQSPLWTFQPGPGHFTDPVIDSGRIYVTFRPSAESSSPTVVIFAIDQANGHALWQQRAAVEGTLHAGGGLLYYRGADHRLHALDGRSGQKRWGIGPATLLRTAGSELFVLDDQKQLLALEAKTGTVRRSYRFQGEENTRLTIAATGQLVLSGKGITVFPAAGLEKPTWTFAPDAYLNALVEADLVLAGDTKQLYALDLATGHQRWSMPVSNSVPQAVDQGLLYHTARDSRQGRDAVHVRDTQTGALRQVLSIADFQPMPYGALTVHAGRIYVPVKRPHGMLAGFSNAADSALCAVNNQSGQPIWCAAWQLEYLNEPVISGNRLYISSTGEDGRPSSLYQFAIQ